MTLLINDLSRIRMLVAGVYAGIAISSTYGYTILTEYLKHKYKFTQSDITMISTVGNCVGYCSFLAGMLFDYAGPMVVLPIAGFLGFLGYFLFGLAFDDLIIANPTVTHFSIFNAILYLGCPALDVAVIMPLMLQFPLDRGYIVMIQKAFSGLGTSIIMTYFNGFFRSSNGDPLKSRYSAYAYFIGAEILFCSLVALCFVRLPAYFQCAWRKARLTEEEKVEHEATLQLYLRQHAPSRRLKMGFLLVFCVLIFSTTQSLVAVYADISRTGYILIAITSLLLMSSFCLIALPFQFLGRYTPVHQTHMDTIGRVANTPSDSEGVSNESAEGYVQEIIKPQPQYDGSFWSHLLSVDLWALWVACFGMWGTGTVLQMNAAQINSSKNNGNAGVSIQAIVAIMAVGSAVGRIAVGFVDVKLSQWQREDKTRILTTIFLPLAPMLLAVAYLLFVYLPSAAIIVPFFLGATGNGVGWGIGTLAVRMLYSQDIGKHYNFLFSCGIVSTIALNRFMFGGMYDAKARQRGETPFCNAPECVNNQMFILMGVNIVSTFAAALVHWRFNRFRQSHV